MFIIPFLTTMLGGFWAKYSFKIILALSGLAVIAAVAIFVWFDIARRERQAAEAAIHKIETQQLKDQIKVIRKDQENQKVNTQRINDNLAKIRTESQKRTNDAAQRDLNAEAQADAKKLEDSINRDTANQLKRIEDLTK